MALNALVAAVGLAIKFGEAATTADPQFTSVFGRVTNELCYFTIESNLIVLAVCVALAWKPERWRWVAGAPRLTGLVCITVTGVVTTRRWPATSTSSASPRSVTCWPTSSHRCCSSGPGCSAVVASCSAGTFREMMIFPIAWVA